MKILWQVSFRPLNKSKSNDDTQSQLIDNIKKFNADITFSITQFYNYGVKNFLKKKNFIFKKLILKKKKIKKIKPKKGKGSFKRKKKVKI